MHAYIRSSSPAQENGMPREMEKQNRMMSHVLAIPIPAQGHINPMAQFSKRLASKELQVTIVIFSSKVLKHTRRLGSVQVVTIDFDGYEGKISLDDYLRQFRATVTRKLPELVAELSTSSGHPISCLLYDSHMPWVLETARQLGLIGASLFTQSCVVDTVYYNIQEMQQKKIPPEKLLVTVSRFPALAALEIADRPSFVQGMESESEYSSLLNQVVGQFSNFKDADWIFVNTFNTLEEEAVNWLASQRSIKPIGPMIPSFYLDRQLEDDKEYGPSLFKPNLDGCNEWLDSKETGSVVYVSFGSLAALGGEQMAEIAWGLKRSDCCFLWVVRESERKKLPINFAEESSGKGVIVSWSQQLTGVPMVAMPQWTDQPTNAKYIADVWQVGVRVKANEKGIVTKEEVEGCIREVMEGERGNAIRRNSEKWMKLAQTVADEGGSSDKNITEFAAELARKFHHETWK
uniref:Glycosyltransferase N-terminal domain-containing protein n=1 Tax=Salix viminalis TaxID=40686 RepID=A0A6N2MMR5_SALVM